MSGVYVMKVEVGGMVVESVRLLMVVRGRMLMIFGAKQCQRVILDKVDAERDSLLC